MIVDCRGCGAAHPFDQPYPFHAGFSTQGFLYNEAGTLTLVWSVYDPAFVAMGLSWERGADDRARIESALAPSPVGDRWLFANPARCPSCGRVLRQPMVQDVYYLLYPGSLRLDVTEGGPGFASVMRGGATREIGAGPYDPSQ